jgi:DNA-binding MarR family transcriptional regulator
MDETDAMAVATLILSASNAIIDGIQAGIAARGFADVRPAHGFAFARLAPAGATTIELAEHLGVTKQAASQLVDELVRKGYVERRTHPHDARARLLVLSERGWACTRAATAAAVETLGRWEAVIGDAKLRALAADIARVVPVGQLRPTW